MKFALVCGAGGFIGGHLVNKLFNDGAASVRAVDVKPLDEWYQQNPSAENLVLDLQKKEACQEAAENTDIVFQLAADMGGMGFIHSAECEVLRNYALINIHMVEAAARLGIPRYFSRPRSAFIGRTRND